MDKREKRRIWFIALALVLLFALPSLMPFVPLPREQRQLVNELNQLAANQNVALSNLSLFKTYDEVCLTGPYGPSGTSLFGGRDYSAYKGDFEGFGYNLDSAGMGLYFVSSNKVVKAINLRPDVKLGFFGYGCDKISDTCVRKTPDKGVIAASCYSLDKKYPSSALSQQKMIK